MFKWQICIKIPNKTIYNSEEEYKNRLPDEDNLPSGICYFVPRDTSTIIVGWYSKDWRKFVPRGAKNEDKMYDPKEILFWSPVDESHIYKEEEQIPQFEPDEKLLHIKIPSLYGKNKND